jgi:hypothetical protein
MKMKRNVKQPLHFPVITLDGAYFLSSTFNYLLLCSTLFQTYSTLHCRYYKLPVLGVSSILLHVLLINMVQ